MNFYLLRKIDYHDILDISSADNSSSIGKYDDQLYGQFGVLLSYSN